jgi:hypothetical protein
VIVGVVLLTGSRGGGSRKIVSWLKLFVKLFLSVFGDRQSLILENLALRQPLMIWERHPPDQGFRKLIE